MRIHHATHWSEMLLVTLVWKRGFGGFIYSNGKSGGLPRMEAEFDMRFVNLEEGIARFPCKEIV